MHIIDECPRCNKDFMYHQTDTYLNRAVAWDADTKEPCSFETICQDCHLKEKWVGKEVKTNHPCFLHLNEFKLVVDGVVVGESHPLTIKIGDTDSYEWFDEEELEMVDNEILDIVEYIKEKAEHRGWENAEYMAANKFGEEKALKAIQYLVTNNFDNNYISYLF